MTKSLRKKGVGTTDDDALNEEDESRDEISPVTTIKNVIHQFQLE